jgi:hypothetical protein
MTDKQRQEIYRWRASKTAQGWCYVNLLLPREVKDKMILYKQKLMEQYRKKNCTQLLHYEKTNL